MAHGKRLIEVYENYEVTSHLQLHFLIYKIRIILSVPSLLVQY